MRYSKEEKAAAALARHGNTVRKPDEQPGYVLPEHRSTRRIANEPFASEEFEKITRDIGWTATGFSEWLRWSRVTSIGQISLFDDPRSIKDHQREHAMYYLSDDYPEELADTFTRADAEQILKRHNMDDLLQTFPTFWQKVLRVWRHGYSAEWLSHPSCKVYQEVMEETRRLEEEGIVCR